MDLRKSIYLLLVFCLSLLGFSGHYFPDIEDYQTLVCDLHTHTVFSDGLVWPTVRIDEAAREHLDGIAISDHIEYQPHKDDLPTNHNRPYEIAAERAIEKSILLIKAAEITRETPPGHYNALFLDDINLLVEPEFLAAIEKANEQNAFVFWNHHTWKGLERGKWTDVQTTMYEKKWLHGMEVANGGTYYPLAHQWCLEKNLTMVGNSDIHDPSLNYQYSPWEHRTVTLVFAKERTVASVQEALRAGRTVVWYKNQLIGRRAYLEPLFNAFVAVSKPHDIENGEVSFELTNDALIDLKLERIGQSGPETIFIAARSSTTVKAKPAEGGDAVSLSYRVTNLLVEPEKGLEVALKVAK